MTDPVPIGARHSLLGPRTVPIHSKISEETAARLRTEARKAEKSVSDFIATLLEVRLFGRPVIERIEAARLEVVSGDALKNIQGVAEK